MLFTDSTFLGIDPTAGKRPFVYAAIDYELNLLAVGEGSLDEVSAFAAGQQKAVVGVCAPRRPNQGFMADDNYRQELDHTPTPGRWHDYRVAEYILCLKNIRIPRTSTQIEDTPGWMKMGYRLYDRLQEIGYVEFPGTDSECMYLEVYPHASYSALLGVLPFKKGTLEGRLQRQLVLYSQNMPIPDPMRIVDEITRYRLLNGVLQLGILYETGELDALVAAYTAWMAVTHPDEITMVGDAEEGRIVIPKRELKEHYS